MQRPDIFTDFPIRNCWKRTILISGSLPKGFTLFVFSSIKFFAELSLFHFHFFLQLSPHCNFFEETLNIRESRVGYMKYQRKKYIIAFPLLKKRVKFLPRVSCLQLLREHISIPLLHLVPFWSFCDIPLRLVFKEPDCSLNRPDFMWLRYAGHFRRLKNSPLLFYVAHIYKLSSWIHRNIWQCYSASCFFPPIFIKWRKIIQSKLSIPTFFCFCELKMS